MTVATVIFYAGVHPYTLKPIQTVKTKKEKQNQNKFFFWYKKENRNWIKNKLEKANRPDLINKLVGDDHQREMPSWLKKRRSKK
jgi:hypothetical protein